MTVGLGLDALDVGEEELLVVQRDLGATLRTFVGELLQPLSEDLGPESARGVTQCGF